MSLQPRSRHIGIIDARRASREQFGDREIGWFVEACNQVLRRELRRIYPEDPVWSVDYYASISDIDLTQIWPMALMDDDGLEDAVGHHYTRWGMIGAAVDCLGRSVDAVLSTIIHELEMCFNPYIVEWAELPDGRTTAREAGDPVQWSTFDLNVSQSFGGVSQNRSFRVQNMVGARYWGEIDSPSVPFDLKGEVVAPHHWPLRGYRIVRDGTKRYSEFGRDADGAVLSARKFGPGSRTWAILRKETPQLTQGIDGRWQAELPLNTGAKLTATGETPQQALEDCRRLMIG